MKKFFRFIEDDIKNDDISVFDACFYSGVLFLLVVAALVFIHVVRCILGLY